MKEYKLNLDDIEEVESTPRRRRHNHQFNNNRNDNHKSITVPYEQEHSHHHHHHYNNDYSELNKRGNINFDENQNYSHQHRRRPRPPHWSEFGCKQILLMIIFGISILVLCLAFFINLILTIKQVITPRFFLPSIILIFMSFMFAGGIMGTYIEPPNMKHRPRLKELLMMRTIIPIIMLIVSLIFLMIGAENIKLMKKNISKAENLCKENKGLSMEEIYIKTNETLNELLTQKDNILYSYKNNLICFPNAKCVKINPNENKYLCNSQDFDTNELSNIKCEAMKIDDKINQFLNNLKNQKDAYLFLDNCIDINKNFLKSNDNNLFGCESEYNLENIKFTKNLTQSTDVKIGGYLNDKVKKGNEEIKKNKEIVIKYEKSKYDYDLECLKKYDYTLSYLLINIYLFIFYFLCFFWIIFGIYSMHYIINLGIEGKMDIILNDGNNENKNMNNNNISNKIEVDGEDNQLIVNK